MLYSICGVLFTSVEGQKFNRWFRSRRKETIGLHEFQAPHLPSVPSFKTDMNKIIQDTQRIFPKKTKFETTEFGTNLNLRHTYFDRLKTIDKPIRFEEIDKLTGVGTNHIPPQKDSLEDIVHRMEDIRNRRSKQNRYSSTGTVTNRNSPPIYFDYYRAPKTMKSTTSKTQPSTSVPVDGTPRTSTPRDVVDQELPDVESLVDTLFDSGITTGESSPPIEDEGITDESNDNSKNKQSAPVLAGFAIPDRFPRSHNSFNSCENNGYGNRSNIEIILSLPNQTEILVENDGGFDSDYNSHPSHRTLTDIVQRASISSNNGTYTYTIYNSTVLPCSRQRFRYGSYNISITTCAAYNCTAIALKTVKNINGKTATNYGSITMCLDPTATLTTKSCGSDFPKLSEIKTSWKPVCQQTNAPTFLNNSHTVSVNSRNRGNITENISISRIEQNSTITKKTEENTTNAKPTTAPLNTTGHRCVISNCSTVEFCTPKVEIRCDRAANNVREDNSYTSCIELEMCNDRNSVIIDREVKLNTRKDTVARDNVVTSQTFKENVSVAP